MVSEMQVPVRTVALHWCCIVSQRESNIFVFAPLRVPDLRSVILLDSQQSGMFNLKDVMQAGSSQYVQQLQDLQRKLSSDDPINIQFTSVNVTELRRGVAGCLLHLFWLHVTPTD